MRTIDHILNGFKDKPNRSLDSAYKIRVEREDDVFARIVMNLSVFILGIIVLIKLFTGL